MNTERLRALARDLNQLAPRSPYDTLSPDFPAVAARLVDKCRADLLNLQGEYHYNCPMDQRFFRAVGLEAGALREFVATGADDGEVASWMSTNAKQARGDRVSWGRRFRRNPLWLFLVFEDWQHVRKASKRAR
ncbi:uncharacterized protein DUF5069 [Roseimicrobium gellanilyticum]|uniref:Uncharacterized protein DUF5069 n=1 Tax=Roseimicrobium gellanilyticum TaxID=748857 RepID=A0A366HSS0_9BACT|nr:DUF5069 domain-containing protein [Roseimicrobium gellanilyticum]RBP45737.1 uncharacterized protein DUF5069 [Roseimicrobium gellanilyticum]